MGTRGTPHWSGARVAGWFVAAIVSGSPWSAALAAEGVIDPAAPGGQLTVVSSVSPDFERRVTELLGRWAPAALKCKPYLAIVSNTGTKTVVAYSVRFTAKLADGRPDVYLVQFKYPTAVSRADDRESPPKRDRELRPGDERVVGAEFEIDPGVNNWWLEQICGGTGNEPARPPDPTVAIDGAILEDGTVVGDADGELTAHFEIFLGVTQALYRDVAERLDQGASVTEVLAHVEREMQKARVREREAREEPNLQAQYYQLAASDLRRWPARAGDRAFRDGLKQAIRAKAFIVVRR